jgi:hypothetical protein
VAVIKPVLNRPAGFGFPNSKKLPLNVVPVSCTIISIVSPATVVVNDVPLITSPPATNI